MKMKIITKEIKIEGKVRENIIKPFGTSSHFVTSRNDRGKYASIIIPENPKYGWILSDEELKEIVKICTKIVKSRYNKLTKHKLQAIQNIQKSKFDLSDLLKVLEILKLDVKQKQLLLKIKKAYNL